MIIPIIIIIVNTDLYFLLFIPPCHPSRLLIVAAAPVGEAIADDRPAANNPILIAIGAASPNTGSNGPASCITLVTSLP